MTSLWLDAREASGGGPSPDEFTPGNSYDAVVVGAGITGLVTALMLARTGSTVMVLEARHVGAVNTGNTTAKLSLLQGTTLSALRSQYSVSVVRAYVDANRAAQKWLLDYLEGRGVPFQYRDAYTFATTPAGAERLRAEATVARAAGLNVKSTQETGLPFAVDGALRLAKQAQFNPMDVLDALAADVRAAGGSIVEGVRVMNVHNGNPLTVVTRRGEVRAHHVVLGTGTPILNRGLYFAKLRTNRSYAAALRLPDGMSPPPGMYLSAEPPTRSLRDYPVPDGGALLLVGGFGHAGGREPSPQAHVDEMLAWARQYYPGAEVTHTWSAQDYQATNLMPFFGKLPRGHGKILFGTGYNKWGMTNGVAAALDITATIRGEKLEWAHTIHHRITSPRGAASTISVNVETQQQNFRDKAALKKLPPITEETSPAEGTGVTGLFHGKPAAVCTVDGVVCRVSAECAHLGGILRWNDAEKSWDCPLHGSRFSAAGKLLEGPATHNLFKLQ
ncbi:FAD-dependent oxidoreductase [Arthrobacter methylotrophus]|uniref:FAD-dependent oxidoreductase n=1 Tax=Arthrobacter methylotrophus TaxID=121291 RepID=A0ABV5USN1_9MICC